MRGVGLAARGGHERADRRRELGHADAPAAGLARRAGRAAWTLDGDESIRRRPVDRIADPLRRKMGADVGARDGRLPPLRVHGAELQGIEYELPVARRPGEVVRADRGAARRGPTSVTEPALRRDHTERMLGRARVPIERDGLR